MDINLLDGNVHRYKKEGCSGNFFILGCMDARGRVWAFEVGERSEVGALESPKGWDYGEIPLSTKGTSNRNKANKINL